MLQIWIWNSTRAMVYGYADKGLDCVHGNNDNVKIMLIDTNGKSLLYLKQSELKKLASFQGYHNTKVNAA